MVPLRPGNAGGGKDPDFWRAFDGGEDEVIGGEPANTRTDPEPPEEAVSQGEGGAGLPLLVAQIAMITARIQHAVAELPEGQLVMSFPRAGRVSAAQIVAELGCVRERFPSADALAREA